jgi:uncharacterized PurR-regulated membrane protein YhhQ (DUF165 family)
MSSLIYILFVILANLTATTILDFGFLSISLGTVIFSFIFTIKDKIQLLDKKQVYILIAVSSLISLIINILLKASIQIVFASVLAFSISNFIDALVFEKVKKNIVTKSLVSNIFGVIFDTIIFNVLAFYNTDLQPIIFNLIITDVIIKIIFSSLIIPTYYANKKTI